MDWGKLINVWKLVCITLIVGAMGLLLQISIQITAKAATTVRFGTKTDTKGRVSTIADGSSTESLYDGKTLLGVVQDHPDDDEDNNTAVMLRKDGTYAIGVCTDFDKSVVIKQITTLSKGGTFTYTSYGRKIRVKISKIGDIEIARVMTPKYPQADRVRVTADNQIENYIDTQSAMSQLQTSTMFLNGKESFVNITQKWTKGFTTSLSGSTPQNGELKVQNSKGEVVVSQTGLKSRKTISAQAGQSKWHFYLTDTGELSSGQYLLNASKSGKVYSQLVAGDTGELLYTSSSDITKNKIAKEKIVVYGVYWEQSYGDEPDSTAKDSGKVLGYYELKQKKGRQWQLTRYKSNKKLVYKTVYRLKSKVKIPVSMVQESVTHQESWLKKHSNKVVRYSKNGKDKILK